MRRPGGPQGRNAASGLSPISAQKGRTRNDGPERPVHPTKLAFPPDRWCLGGPRMGSREGTTLTSGHVCGLLCGVFFAPVLKGRVQVSFPVGSKVRLVSAFGEVLRPSEQLCGVAVHDAFGRLEVVCDGEVGYWASGDCVVDEGIVRRPVTIQPSHEVRRGVEAAATNPVPVVRLGDRLGYRWGGAPQVDR